MSGWAASGYEEIDEKSTQYGDPSDNVRTAWTPVGSTKRYVILDDNPFAFWQHSLWSLGVKDQSPICLKRNGKLSETFGECPACEASEKDKSVKLWPQFVGYVTVIDCGELKDGKLKGYVSNKDVEYNFDRKILPLKKGGKDKPGLLNKIRRLREKKGGSLVGAVIDMYRGGQKEERPGTEWEYVGKIDVSTLETLKAGLKAMDEINGEAHKAMIDKVVTDNGRVDFDDHFKPLHRKEFLSLMGKSGGGGGGGGYKPPSEEQSSFGGGGNSGGTTDYGGGGGSDEDIPF